MLAAVVVAVVAPAGPAAASTPDSWPDPDPVSTLQALLLFGGIPAALGVVIALLTLAPAVVRGSTTDRSRTWWGEPEWFGGPTGELDAGAARRPRELEAGAPGGRGAGGGAGARW